MTGRATPEIKLKRKLFRLVGLLFPALYLAGDVMAPGAGWVAAVAVLVLFLAIMFTLESIRFRRPGVNRWLFVRFQSFTKTKEVDRTSSTTMFLLACFLTILIFNKGVAVAAMLMLVFGDPTAEIVGTRYGRIPLLGKSLEGTLAGLFACLIAVAALPHAGLGLVWPVLLVGALGATIFELLPAPVDDNFVIPLGAGALMTLHQAILHQGNGPAFTLSPLVNGLLEAAGLTAG